MLTIPRSAVRAFRSVFRKCIGGRFRGFAPPVSIRAEGETVAMIGSTGPVTVRLTVPASGCEGAFVVAADTLEALEGATEVVQIDIRARGRAVARWIDRGTPKSTAIALLPPADAPQPFDLPESWSEMSGSFTEAMHEAGKMAARESGRFSVHRIQIQGAEGRLVGTDAKHALIVGGLEFPFTGKLCVPAVPVFGAEEFSGLPVRVGRTETHVVVRIGAWTVWLTIDAEALFPDVESAIPKSKVATAIHLSETDAALLIDLMPQFPGRDEESAPVTLAIEPGRVAVLGQGSRDDTPAEVFLTGTRSSGRPVRIAVDRSRLLRALALGCRRLKFSDPEKPFSAFGSNRTYLATLLDPSRCVGSQACLSATIPPAPQPPQETTMPKPNPEPESLPTDLLAEAESLRSDIYEIGQRISRIITILKSKKKDERTLNQVFTSLKALQLGGPPR